MSKKIKFFRKLKILKKFSTNKKAAIEFTYTRIIILVMLLIFLIWAIIWFTGLREEVIRIGNNIFG